MTFRFMLSLLLTISFLLLSVVQVIACGAQETDAPKQTADQSTGSTETWLGTLDVKVAKLRLQLEISTDAEGIVSGNMISLDQTTTPIALESLIRTDKKLEFEIKQLGVKFAGTIDESGKVATGKFTQGQAFDLVFKKVDAIPTFEHRMTWVGMLVAGPQEFEFQFRVFIDSDGNHSAKLDSFSEGIMSLPVDLEIDGNEVNMKIPASNAEFVGTLSDDQKTVDGQWLQRGGKYPLTLKQIPVTETRAAKLNRPQTPQPPFPYLQIDFSVKATDIDPKFNAEVVLAGTLTTPKSDGPFPTIILISGSGQQDRDETIFEHKPFAVIADHLTRNGFAVIRFDDRGVGKSKGRVLTATTVDFADDVETVFRWAQSQPQVNGRKIALVGHSEGGIIAPIVANRQPHVAGVVLLAGTGVSGREIILNQSRKIAEVSGVPAKVLDMQDRFLTTAIAEVLTGQATAETIEKIADTVFADLSDKEKKQFELENVAASTFAMMNSPWMKNFLQYDPRESLAKIKCPVLALNGETDLQVTPELNMGPIETALKSGGNPDFELKQLPGLNHLFQTSNTGSPSDYVKIEETVSPLMLDALTSWLKKRFQ